jgi:hypothetical protein
MCPFCIRAHFVVVLSLALGCYRFGYAEVRVGGYGAAGFRCRQIYIVGGKVQDMNIVRVAGLSAAEIAS